MRVGQSGLADYALVSTKDAGLLSDQLDSEWSFSSFKFPTVAVISLGDWKTAHVRTFCIAMARSTVPLSA
jgi:hypothetical protein